MSDETQTAAEVTESPKVEVTTANFFKSALDLSWRSLLTDGWGKGSIASLLHNEIDAYLMNLPEDVR